MDASPAMQKWLIKSIFAASAFDGYSRRLEDWVGKSLDAVNRDERPAKASQAAYCARTGGGSSRG